MRLWGRCPGSGTAAARGEADISGAAHDDARHATAPQRSVQNGPRRASRQGETMAEYSWHLSADRAGVLYKPDSHTCSSSLTCASVCPESMPTSVRRDTHLDHTQRYACILQFLRKGNSIHRSCHVARAAVHPPDIGNDLSLVPCILIPTPLTPDFKALPCRQPNPVVIPRDHSYAELHVARLQNIAGQPWHPAEISPLP